MSHFKDRVEEAQKKLDVLRGDVAELMGMCEVEERDLSSDESIQLEEYASQIEATEKRIADLERAEKAMAERVIEKQAPAQVRSQHLGDQKREPGEIIFKQATAQLIAHVTKKNILEVAKTAYPTDQGLHAVIKSAIAPADSSTDGWAAQLTDDARRGYMDILRGVSIAAQLWPSAGMNLAFDGYTSIKIPNRAGGTTDLASGWTGEGDALPVRRATVGSQTLYPFKWGAITQMTKEIIERSTPNIQALLTAGIVQDTATKLDADYFDSTAAAAGYRPAGTFNGVSGTAAATGGATVGDDMLLDLRNLIDPIFAANMGERMRIVMHPSNALAMSVVLYNGTYLFRDELARGQIFGIPVIQSTNAPTDELWCFDMAQLAVASSAPTISVSDSATIVEVSDDGVAPAMGAAHPRNPTGAVGGPNGAGTTTPLSGVRSLWQTEAVAIKSVQYLSWATLRSGAVNKITGVDY